MTDLECFIALYKTLGIDLTVTQDKEEQAVGRIYFQQIEIVAHSHPKIVGYYDFFTKIIFDLNGKFISQGFYK